MTIFSTRWGKPAAVCAAALLCAAQALAQTRPGDPDGTRIWAAAPSAPADSEVLDRVVAAVNGSVILQSDVVAEERFAQLEPFRFRAAGNDAQQALRHLIDRALILQQIHEQQGPLSVSDAELDKQLSDLRRHLPACAEGKCDSDPDWRALLAAHGFTETQFDQRWRQRMLVLAFIERRFRDGVRISKPEIQAYYTRSFAPQFEKNRLTPPPLSAVSARIEEILLQQHVNGLLSEWLNSLKDEGSVAILDAQYAQLGSPDSDEEKEGNASGDEP